MFASYSNPAVEFAKIQKFQSILAMAVLISALILGYGIGIAVASALATQMIYSIFTWEQRYTMMISYGYSKKLTIWSAILGYLYLAVGVLLSVFNIMAIIYAVLLTIGSCYEYMTSSKSIKNAEEY